MGGQQPQQSLFGSTSAQPLFGSTNQGSIFGSAPNTVTPNTFGSQPTTSAFGGTSSNIFGGNQQSSSLFGGSRFGTTSSTSPFGSTPLGAAAPSGTTIKFNPTAGTDTMMKNGVSQSINTRHQCITCMREYENKSLEELRLEDYTANRKGPQSGGVFGTTGAVSNTSNLFGTSSASNAFSTANTGLFGQNKTSFGSIAPTTTSSGLFGQSAFNQNNKPLFGTTTSFANTSTPASTNSLFGSVATSNPSLNNSFFSGSTNTTATVKPLFGTTAAQPQQSLFGQTSTQNSSLAAKPLFGNTATSVPQFGQTNTSTLFNPGTSSNLFGSTSQPSLFNTGTTSSNNSLAKPLFSFNSTAPLNSSIGATNVTSTSSLFPTTSNAFGNSGSLFGTSGASSFNFGQTNPSYPSATAFQNNAGLQPIGGITSSVNTDQLVTRFQTFPYGDSPQLQINVSLPSNATIRTKFTTDPTTLNQYKISAKSRESKPQRYVNSSPKVNTMLFDGLEDENPSETKTAKDIFVPRKNVKKLIFRPKNTSTASDLNASHNTSTFLIDKQNNEIKFDDDSIASTNTVNEFVRTDDMIKSSEKSKFNISAAETSDILTSNVSDISQNERDQSIHSDAVSITPKCGVVLTRSDYYTIPPFEELDNYYEPSTDSCVVPNFTVGRHGYGSIFWEGPLDIKGLNLDQIVFIRRKEVIVYPDEDLAPKRGEGLNRPAQITLDQVWPIDKTSREPIKDKERLRAMRYTEKIESATNKLQASFKEYRPETGSWVFTVKHFSKYGLTDDDDEEIVHNGDPKQTVTEPNTNIGLVADKRLLFSNDQQLSLESKLNDITPEDIPPKLSAKDNTLNFLFDEDADEMFAEELSQMGAEMAVGIGISSQVSRPTEFDKMRNTLFDDYDQVFSKKSRTYPVISPAKDLPKPFPSLLTPKIRPIILKKRELSLRSDVFAAQNKLICDISSVCMSGSPKLSFFNGSRNFLFIKGTNVLICELNLIDMNALVIDRFEEQLRRNSQIIRTTDRKTTPLWETREFSKNTHNSLCLEQLVEALFGPLTEVTPYACHQQRIDRILNWLFLVNKKYSIPKSSHSKILHFLSTNELEVAIEEALDHNNPRLASLLALGSNINNGLVMAQLDAWRRSKADAFIDQQLIKIYALMAGLIEWKLSDQTTVEVLAGLTWTQQLALILLYKTPPDVDKDELGLNLLSSAISSLTIVPQEVEYHLLAGHTPWISMCWSPTLLDAWFLHESLKSFHVIVNDKDSLSTSDSVHSLVASQLKDIRWACFVASHIRNDAVRERLIKELISVNAHHLKQNDDSSQWLSTELCVPSEYLSQGLALQSKSVFDHKNLAFNLMDCHQWSEAHDVLVQWVWPQMIINEENDSIQELIARLEPHSHEIGSWRSTGGHIYATYLKCLRRSNLEDVRGFNIHQLPSQTKVQVLCQSEMARKVNIIFSELSGQFAYNTPIPDDYALVELKLNAKRLIKSLC